jgi:hypothetical protein
MWICKRCCQAPEQAVGSSTVGFFGQPKVESAQNKVDKTDE